MQSCFAAGQRKHIALTAAQTTNDYHTIREFRAQPSLSSPPPPPPKKKRNLKRSAAAVRRWLIKQNTPSRDLHLTCMQPASPPGGLGPFLLHGRPCARASRHFAIHSVSRQGVFPFPPSPLPSSEGSEIRRLSTGGRWKGARTSAPAKYGCHGSKLPAQVQSGGYRSCPPPSLSRPSGPFGDCASGLALLLPLCQEGGAFGGGGDISVCVARLSSFVRACSPATRSLISESSTGAGGPLNPYDVLLRTYTVYAHFTSLDCVFFFFFFPLPFLGGEE